jgi:nucleoside-diphosphate-sugar epimerase
MRDDTFETDLFLGDVIDDVDVTEAFAHCDAFIHLAAVLGTQETIQNPRPAAKSNLLGGLNVLEAAAQYDVPGTYIGVGNYWMNNTYSITKTMIERFIDMFNKDRGTRINIVRAMNAYGPRQVPASPYGPAKVRKITPSFVCRALTGHDVEIYGDGTQVSDMIHVKDVAKALVNAMELAMDSHLVPTVEIGPKINKTVNEVAETIIKLSNSTSKIVHLPMRPGELPGSVVTADISTLEAVGMDPDEFITLEDGMKETIEYFEKYLYETNYK